MTTKCAQCGGPLGKLFPAMYGRLYCSKDCAIGSLMNNMDKDDSSDYFNSAYDAAEQEYEDVSEIVGRDILE